MKQLASGMAVLWMLACGFVAHGDAGPAPAPTRESAATLVVFNNQDPSSVALALYYARRRAIPGDHLVGLDCPLSEEISRAQYDQTIAAPLRKLFADRHWWHAPADPSLPASDNVIRFMALMRGIPLKIAATSHYPGDSFTGKQAVLDTNAAAVDSELATLGIRTHKISGPIKNLYYLSFTPFMDTPFAALMLVCRLDGPTDASVRNMIDGGIAAEQAGGLEGFAYIDMRGLTSGPLMAGDTWLTAAAGDLRQYGMPVITDSTPALFPAGYPMDHAAIYLGWYSTSVAGPMAADTFRFNPGAIAVHIYSFSAATLRDPAGSWAGSLVAHGAAATLGNVYEPYLVLTPNLDVFADRLRNGFTFAESAYAAEPVLSWMTTFIGDPLYRPFQDGLAQDPPSGKPAIEYAACKEGAHAWYEKGSAEGFRQLFASARSLHSGIVWEELGLLQRSIPDYESAIGSFQAAEKCYGVTDDGLRAVLDQAEAMVAAGAVAKARALAARELDPYAALPGASLLRGIIGLPDAPSGSAK